MAGINMAQLTGTGSVKASSSSRSGSSSSVRETSKSDFADMIQGKVKDSAPEKKPDSNTPVKNQEGSTGKPEQPGSQTDKTDTTKPETKDSAAKPDGTQEKELAGTMAELQAVLNQMMVQNLGETSELADQLTESAKALEAVAQGKVLEKVQEAAAGDPESAARAEAAKELTGSLQNFESVAAAQEPADQAAKKAGETDGQKQVSLQEALTARAQTLSQTGQVTELTAAQSAGSSPREETGAQDSRSQEGTGSIQEMMASGMTGSTQARDALTAFEMPRQETVTVPTTPETFPQDVGNRLAASLPRTDGTLTIELEPASLGKMTIRVVYEAGKAAVSIVSENPRTLELLSQNASEIARILEEKTGQVTEVYTPDPRQQMEEGQTGQEHRQRRQDEPEKQKHDQTESFTQMLRLGLV